MCNQWKASNVAICKINIALAVGSLHGEQKKFWPKSSDAEKCLLGWMLHATAFTPTFSHLH